MLFQMKYIKLSFHGRAAMITDVLIDSMGVFTGILLVMIIIKICKMKEKYKWQENIKKEKD